MSTRSRLNSIDMQKVFAVYDSLKEESDRARAIVVTAWVDHILELKLKSVFCKGNSRARSKLFSSTGPFATLAAKIQAAYCAGWIDPDVYSDLEHLRKIRNVFAHKVGELSLNTEEMRKLVDGFQVSRRLFTDGGKLRAAEVEGGFVLYTGEKPEEAKAPLEIGRLRFKQAMSILIVVLLANLGLQMLAPDGSFLRIVLPENMKLSRKDASGNADGLSP